MLSPLTVFLLPFLNEMNEPYHFLSLPHNDFVQSQDRKILLHKTSRSTYLQLRILFCFRPKIQAPQQNDFGFFP